MPSFTLSVTNRFGCRTFFARFMYSTKPLTPPEKAKFSSLPERWSMRTIFTPLLRNDSSRSRRAAPLRRAGRLERRHGGAAAELHLVHLAVAPDRQPQPFGKPVDHGHADAVQAAGHLV